MGRVSPKKKSPKKKSGPFEVVEAKSVKVPIYSTPAFGVQSFTIAYYANGKRHRERAGTIEQARKQARAKIDELTTGAAHIGSLTPRETAVVEDALETLRPIGVRLSTVCREYVEAFRILGGIGSIMEAAKLLVEKQASLKIPSRTLPQVVEEFKTRIATRGLSPLYKRDCRIRLARAAKAFTGQITAITADDVDAWLSSGSASARSKNNDRQTLVTLFEFAKSKGYLPIVAETAAKQSIKRKTVSGEITILTPNDFATLLKSTPSHFLPLVAIGGLAGIRTAEIFRLAWTDIDLKSCHIVIEADKAKTASRRIVPVCPALKTWLAPLKKKSGPLWSYRNLQGFMNAWSKCKAELPVKVPTNALRHSYASYRLAQIKDAAKVALEMGNSPRKLFENYREIVTPAAAKQWFATSKP